MQISLHRKTIRDIADRFETFTVISKEKDTSLKMMLEDHSQILKAIVGQETALRHSINNDYLG